jgi:hypothetical protein
MPAGKVFHDAGWLLLEASHEGDDILLDLLDGSRCFFRVDVLLEVTVQVLVGVEFRRVAGDKLELDDALLSLHPCGDLFPVMDSEVVSDHHHRAVVGLHQLREEEDKFQLCHRGGVAHEADLSFVGHATDHVHFPLRPVLFKHGCPADGRVAPLRIGLVGHSRLVDPVDRGVAGLGPAGDGRVGLAKPLVHRRGTLLPRLAQGLLGGKVPFPQVLPHRPHGEEHSETVLDEIADRRCGPKHKRHLQLVGGMVGDQPDDRRALVPFELGLLAGTATSLPEFQSLSPALLVKRNRFAHRLPRDPKRRRCLKLRKPFLANHSDGRFPDEKLLLAA